MLQAIETRTHEATEKINPFLFEEVESKLLRKPSEGVLVRLQYQEMIQELSVRGQVSTANIYKLSERSIREFVESSKRNNYNKLSLYGIDKRWLLDYEKYMTQEKGKSLTTVSIYLRPLRAVFNSAI